MGEQQVLNAAASQGLFALLFVSLLFYVLKQNEKREIGYQTTIKDNQGIISRLTDTISVKITGMEDDIKEIKENVGGIRNE